MNETIRAEVIRADAARIATLAAEAYMFNPAEIAEEMELDDAAATWDAIDADLAAGTTLPFAARWIVGVRYFDDPTSARLMLLANARHLRDHVGPVAARAYVECFGLSESDL